MSTRMENVLDIAGIVLDVLAWLFFAVIAAVALFTAPALTVYLLVLMGALAGVDIYLDNLSQRALWSRDEQESEDA